MEQLHRTKVASGQSESLANGWKAGARNTLRADMHELRAELKALAYFEQY